MKKKVFEAAFPLHKVRLSLGEKSRRDGGAGWGGGGSVSEWGCTKSSLGEGHSKAPSSCLGAGQVIKGALMFLHPTNFSALQKEKITKILEKKWARWGVLFKEQPIDKIR